AYGEKEDFFTMKSMVSKVLDLFSVKVSFERSGENYLHPGRQAMAVSNDEILATFGQVHPNVAKSYGIDADVFLAEIKLDKLFAIKQQTIVFKAMPKFPATQRDLALICDNDIPVAALENAIREGAGKICEKIELFDVYTGAQIPTGKKSVAYSMTFRSSEGTLTDEIIDRATNKVMKKLEAVGAILRS
ncbi:MAG: phenylalanine--tRNA ligase subunit beta, partial [Oscillospiraceae bacterium]